MQLATVLQKESALIWCLALWLYPASIASKIQNQAGAARSVTAPAPDREAKHRQPTSPANPVSGEVAVSVAVGRERNAPAPPFIQRRRQ